MRAGWVSTGSWASPLAQRRDSSLVLAFVQGCDSAPNEELDELLDRRFRAYALIGLQCDSEPLIAAASP